MPAGARGAPRCRTGARADLLRVDGDSVCAGRRRGLRRRGALGLRRGGRAGDRQLPGKVEGVLGVPSHGGPRRDSGKIPGACLERRTRAVVGSRVVGPALSVRERGSSTAAGRLRGERQRFGRPEPGARCRGRRDGFVAGGSRIDSARCLRQRRGQPRGAPFRCLLETSSASSPAIRRRPAQPPRWGGWSIPSTGCSGDSIVRG